MEFFFAVVECTKMMYIVFHETFNELKMFESVYGVENKDLKGDCKTLVHKFDIVLKKVQELKSYILSYKPETVAQQRILTTLFNIYALYNRTIVLKAITIARVLSITLILILMRIKRMMLFLMTLMN